MNILILGSGGREHTFAWKMAQSPNVDQLYVAPGNAGTASIAKNIPIGVDDFEGIKEIVLANKVDMMVVGPEDPLVNGIHDFFLQDAELRHIAVIGPQQAAAKLEGSKDFAKQFMQRHGIPTAAYQSFTGKNLDKAYRFLETLDPPYVLKADGLAAGKGVVILNDLGAARQELRAMLVDAKFGNAGNTVVIEEFLSGIELSVFVLTDGESYKILPTAKDYKRIGEGDKGLNTGGMGAISPVPFADKELMQSIDNRIVKPTLEGLKRDNLPYQGFIFIGLIKVGNDPYVIEYNVRMGDPETEVVLPRIKNDLVDLFKALADKELHRIDLELDERSATTVMTVSGGYPEAYEKGHEILGLETLKDALVFHAGTKLENGKVRTNGGRVMAFTGFGDNFREALSESYANIQKVCFEKMAYRKDIGFDL
ncbi:MAG: phosphoribosylamine--glycine ligase [Bacteroidota bacterium]